MALTFDVAECETVEVDVLDDEVDESSTLEREEETTVGVELGPDGVGKADAFGDRCGAVAADFPWSGVEEADGFGEYV